MEDYSPHFTGFSGLDQQDFFSTHHAPEEPVDLSTLIEQSLTPLSVGEIINTMNQNNFMQHTSQHQLQQQPVMSTLPPQINTNVTTLNNLNMYQLMTGTNGSMPVIIVNIPGLVSPQTPSAEMSNLNLQEGISGASEDIEPPCKKRRPSVVEENDIDVMSLSHQMDLLRRNSLPVLHSIHVPRYTSIPPSISVDELISPSKFIRDDVDLLDEFGSDVIRAEDEEEVHREQNDSPPMVSQPFNFANFYVAQPPEKEQAAAPLTLITSNIPPPIQTTNITPNITPVTPNADLPPKSGRQQRRRKSTPAGETPTSTPGTPMDGMDRKLVCLGKRPRKNKKTQPEDQFLMKFTMRKNK